MPNSFFSFKQFTVRQEHCAMKVCTDACLFGAWVADKMIQLTFSPDNILDIGTGTGLLSLMLAQKLPAPADAVEIEAAAAKQAAENFDASPWKERLTLIHTAVQELSAGKNYDLIICNPPFFENDLRPADANKNTAKHEGMLMLPELLHVITGRLTADGYAALLLPYHRYETAITTAAGHGLFLQEQVLVKQTPAHPYFRCMLLFGKKKAEVKKAEMEIHDAERHYTEAFRKLLGDYYLKL